MESVATPVEPIETRAALAERAVAGLVLALVANAVVRSVAAALVDVRGIDPLGWGPIVTATVVSAVGATLVYAAVSRFSAHPDRDFTVIAAVVLLLSMAPVFTVAPTFPGVGTAVLIVLVVLHVTTAVGIVAGLTGLVHR